VIGGDLPEPIVHPVRGKLTRNLSACPNRRGAWVYWTFIQEGNKLPICQTCSESVFGPSYTDRIVPTVNTKLVETPYQLAEGTPIILLRSVLQVSTLSEVIRPNGPCCIAQVHLLAMNTERHVWGWEWKRSKLRFNLNWLTFRWSMDVFTLDCLHVI